MRRRSTPVRWSALLAALSSFALVAGCSNLPSRAFLRYAAQDVRDWQVLQSGQLTTTALGARFVLDLQQRDTRVQMICENEGAVALQVAVGPEATRGSTQAIGELRVRPISGDRAEGVPDFAPYRSLEVAVIESGWRGEFFLDSPLGREPTLGQYIVLVLEVRSGDQLERRLLPLVATNRD